MTLKVAKLTSLFVIIGVLILIYPLCLLCCLFPKVQKLATYVHFFKLPSVRHLHEPERWGYGKNQVIPMTIETPDSEKLFAWYILPRTLFGDHESDLYADSTPVKACLGSSEKFPKTLAYRLVHEDLESKLVIFFHGNSGHLSMGNRGAMLRSFTALAPNVHLLTFDPRSFGRSTGKPNEEGVILDGITIVNWAVTTLGIPRSRIILVGQSMGTMIVGGVAEHFLSGANAESGNNYIEDFAGLVLVSGFRDLKDLLLSFSVKGIIPIVAPLRIIPPLQRFLLSRLVETWETERRLQSILVRALDDQMNSRPRDLKLHLVHAVDDVNIPYHNSEEMYIGLRNTFANKTNTKLTISRFVDGGRDFTKPAVWSVNSGAGVAVSMRLVKIGAHEPINYGTTLAVDLLRLLEGRSF